MTIGAVPVHPGALPPDEAEAAHTRSQVLDLIVSEGPIAAAELADRLGLTPAGVRRHLAALVDEGQIVSHDVPSPSRGRGRPARHFVATQQAHSSLTSECSEIAVEALRFVCETLGDRAVEDFARRRVAEFEAHYAARVEAAGSDLASRTTALADALTEEGYAATSRPIPVLHAIQLCQGHCPVGHVAQEFPQLCEAEAEGFSRILGVHVQRLATLAGGEHVCTTSIPVGGPIIATALEVKENA